MSVTSTQYTRATKYFKTERMRRAFTFAAMYLVRPFRVLSRLICEGGPCCGAFLWPEPALSRRRAELTLVSPFAQGMSPFDALGAYNLLQYTEHCEGILYPLGGFGTVPKALQKIAERNGAKFRFNSTVKRVVVQDGAAKGVELEGGEILSADIVLVNADLVWSMAHLYQETAYSKRLEEKPVSCSSISFYWAMNRCVPTLLICDDRGSDR